jgi:hypothetical protein
MLWRVVEHWQWCRYDNGGSSGAPSGCVGDGSLRRRGRRWCGWRLCRWRQSTCTRRCCRVAMVQAAMLSDLVVIERTKVGHKDVGVVGNVEDDDIDIYFSF